MGDLNSLHNQIRQGDLAGVRSSLAGDPELLNGTNESGQNAFLLAKYYRQPEIAEYLLSLSPKLDLFSSCAAGRVGAVTDQIDRDKLSARSTQRRWLDPASSRRIFRAS